MSTDTRRESSGDTKTADTTDGSDATSLMLYTLVAFGDVEKAKECFDNGMWIDNYNAVVTGYDRSLSVFHHSLCHPIDRRTCTCMSFT